MDNAKLVVDGDKWGRNLLKGNPNNEPILVKVNNNYYKDYCTDIVLEVGQTYTFSWDYEIKTTDRALNIAVGAGENAYVRDIRSWVPIEDGKVTFTVEERHLERGNKFHYRLSRSTGGTNTSEVEYRSIKLEKGSQATPWTPAPEDFNNVATWNDLMKSKVFDLSMPLEVGEYYTLSINDTPSSYFQLWSDNETFVADLVDGVITFKVIEDGVNSIVLKSHNMNELQWVKLEKGKKATDWIPTPEDIYDKADKTVVDDVIQEVDRLETVTATKEELGEVLASLNEYRRVLESSEVDLQTAKEEIATLLSRIPLIENNLGEFVESWTFLDTYVRLGEEGLLIGSETGATAIRITDDRIDFLDGSGEPVAYITNQIMRINRGIFVDSAQIGEHKIETIEDGHTIFTWMG
jgi:hypothetical protein